MGKKSAERSRANQVSAEESFADDIERAIQLRKMFFQRDLDRQFEDDGGKVIYAVDSNIINMHFQLSDQKASRRYRGACRAFEGPNRRRPEEKEVRLAQVVASFIVSQIGVPFSGDFNPLLMLPGHSNEAKSKYDSLIGNFDKQVDRGRNARVLISEFLQKFHAERNSEKRRDLTAQFETGLHKQLFVLSEPHERFREFNRLLAKPRLLSLRRAGAQPLLREFLNPATKIPIFHDYKRINQDGEYEGSAAWWDKRLSGDIPIWFREADKNALSTLDMLNQLLRRHDVRVVLFTLGEDIVQLGEKYRPFKHVDTDLGKYSFTDLYVRHPKALLAEPQSLKLHLDGQRRGDITVWLDTFIQEVTGREYETFDDFKWCVRSSVGERRNLLDLASNALAQHPDIHRSLYSQWHDYLQSATLAPASSSYEAKELFAAYLKNTDDNSQELLSEFETYIRKLTEDSWDNFFFTTLRSGSDMIGEHDEYNNRNVPILFLRGMGAAGDLLRKLSRTSGVIKNEAQVRKLLADLDRSRDDHSGYISSICYAILFAHADRWSITKLITSRAVHIAEKVSKQASAADRLTQTFGVVTGREAFYFSAIAHRLTARGPDDLDDCDRLLAKAVEAMVSEEHLALEEPDNPKLTGLRFRAEGIALSMTRLLFRAREQLWRLGDDPQFEYDVRGVMKSILAELNKSSECQDDFICAASRLSLTCNLITGVFLLEVANVLQKEDGEFIASVLNAHLSNLDSVYGIDNTSSELSVLDIYLAMYAASFKHAVNPLLERIDRAYNEIESRPDRRVSISAMPYDKKRYELIVKFIDSR